jgi:hypothetical protein
MPGSGALFPAIIVRNDRPGNEARDLFARKLDHDNARQRLAQIGRASEGRELWADLDGRRDDVV